MLNGHAIQSIFTEKQYTLREGLFGRFIIDCCKSQLVIIFKGDHEISTLNDIPTNWTVVGFDPLHSGMIVKYYNQLIFSDSININIVPYLKDSLDIIMMTLRKKR